MLKRAFTAAAPFAVALGAVAALPVTTFAQPAGTNPPISADANSESGASYRASDLLNQQVKNENGDVIADIEDFVLDAQTNQVQYVVLSYGGAPEGQFVVVPFSAVHVHYENEAILVRTPLTVDVLKAAPTFAANEWVTVIRQPNWYTGVNQYWTDAGVNVNVGPGAIRGRGPGDRGPGRGPNAGNLNPDRPRGSNPDRPDATDTPDRPDANPDRPRAGSNPDRPGAGAPDRPNPNPTPDRPNAGSNPDRPAAGSNPDRPGAGANPDSPNAGSAPRTPGGPGPQNPGAGTPDAPAPPSAPGAGANAPGAGR
jgi:sporulation protein YlmC with PRC-barrel domain